MEIHTRVYYNFCLFSLLFLSKPLKTPQHWPCLLKASGNCCKARWNGVERMTGYPGTAASVQRIFCCQAPPHSPAMLHLENTIFGELVHQKSTPSVFLLFCFFLWTLPLLDLRAFKPVIAAARSALGITSPPHWWKIPSSLQPAWQP